MNILLVHDQAEVREMLRFGIETRYSLEVFEVKNPEEAITQLAQFQANKSALAILSNAHSSPDAVKALEDKTDFHLIVCQFGPNVAKLTEFLKEQEIKSPFVLWNSSGTKLQKGLGDRILEILSGKDVVPDLLRILDDLKAQSRFSAKEGAKDTSLDDIYCPIATQLLIRVSPLKADIFIRLSEKKYVRLFPEGETFDLQDLRKYYKEKNVEFLYLHRDEVGEFLLKFRSDLDELLNSDVVDVAKSTTAVAEAQEIMHEMLSRTGFTEDVQEIARQSVKLTMKVMGESPELVAILNRLREGKEKYITMHSTLLAHVASAISATMTWNSSATYEKLTLAALLHDITLKNQEIAKISTLAELESRKGEFTEEDIKAFKNHPIEASMMVRKMNKIPADVDAIIAQHHEQADGSGFPRGLSHTHIGHLSCLFIIAHDMTRSIMEKGDHFSLEEFIGERRNNYTKGNFRKIIDALLEEMEKGARIVPKPPSAD